MLTRGSGFSRDSDRSRMSIEFHRRMLADDVRNAAFREALRRVIVPGRTTVADIGAGTGILAFMARDLGARELWLYDPGPVLGLAETIAAKERAMLATMARGEALHDQTNFAEHVATLDAGERSALGFTIDVDAG